LNRLWEKNRDVLRISTGEHFWLRHADASAWNVLSRHIHVPFVIPHDVSGMEGIKQSLYMIESIRMSSVEYQSKNGMMLFASEIENEKGMEKRTTYAAFGKFIGNVEDTVYSTLIYRSSSDADWK
jgi:hypothetical protein